MTRSFDGASPRRVRRRPFVVSVIVCANNQAHACSHAWPGQTRLPDEILVIDNDSTDATRAVPAREPAIRLAGEPRKGLVVVLVGGMT